MNFEITPDEAQPIAKTIVRYLSHRRFKTKLEIAGWSDVPYRTTIVAIRAELTVLVEAQGTLEYSSTLKSLATWLAAKRHYAEFYIATHEEATTNAGILAELKKDGVGLFIIDHSGVIHESSRARNPALIVTPEPTLRFGHLRDEVLASVVKFNEVNRKDGLRDMCELVERETESLAIAAARKGLLTIPEHAIVQQDWASRINSLASPRAYNNGINPIVTLVFKDDLHSFRNARNLIDHKVSNKRDDAKRQKQFAERMMQGPRLIAELLSLRRKLC